MTDAFEAGVTAVLGYEGRYVNDSRDPGGGTNSGISKRAYPSLDIKNLTREQAIQIYRRDYWDAGQCGQLPAGLAVAVFDGAVNQGVRTAVMTLQEALGIVVDGVVGPTTLAAAKQADPAASLADYLARRAVRYGELPTFTQYGHGWMRRLFQVQQVCLQAESQP